MHLKISSRENTASAINASEDIIKRKYVLCHIDVTEDIIKRKCGLCHIGKLRYIQEKIRSLPYLQIKISSRKIRPLPQLQRKISRDRWGAPLFIMSYSRNFAFHNPHQEKLLYYSKEPGTIKQQLSKNTFQFMFCALSIRWLKLNF